MTDLLLGVLAAALLGALVLAVLVAVTVVPFVVAVSRADAVGASPVRTGALSLAACGLGVVAAALLVLRTDVVRPVAVLVLLAGWAVPLLVGRVPGFGRRGGHEPA